MFLFSSLSKQIAPLLRDSELFNSGASESISDTHEEAIVSSGTFNDESLFMVEVGYGGGSGMLLRILPPGLA